MTIRQFWRFGMVVLLVLVSLVAYKSTAIEPTLKESNEQCCNKEKQCPLKKTPGPAASGSSIIWDSMSDNLLSTHI